MKKMMTYMLALTFALGALTLSAADDDKDKKKKKGKKKEVITFVVNK